MPRMSEAEREAHLRRMHTHGHNAQLGGLAFAQQWLRKIALADSNTPDAKRIATTMLGLCSELEDDIRTWRMDNGVAVAIKHKRKNKESM